MLVVPGGGPFADAVRTVDRDGELGDRLAHRLALAAMDQLGMVLRGCCPKPSRSRHLRAPAALGLLLAASAFAGRPDVPETWAVTSDSLAVLAAGAIGADEAILLKPVDGVFETWPGSGPPLAALTAGELRALQRAGEGRAVDPYLPDAIEQTGVTVIVRAPGHAPTRPTASAPARAGTRRPPARGSRLTDGGRAQLGDGRGDELGVQRRPAVTAVADGGAHPDDVGLDATELAGAELARDAEAAAGRARARDEVFDRRVRQPPVQPPPILDERVDQRPRDPRPRHQLGQQRRIERRRIGRRTVRVRGGDHARAGPDHSGADRPDAASASATAVTSATARSSPRTPRSPSLT